MAPPTVRVGIVTGEGLLAVGVASSMQQDPHLDVVGLWQPGGGLAFADWMARANPHVVVMDTEDGRELLAEATGRSGDNVAFVVLTTLGSAVEPGTFISLGARAVIGHGASADDLRHVVRLVARGHRVLSEAIAPTLVRRLERSAGACVLDISALTARESEVLEDVAMGCSNEQIAARRHMSVGTVKVHLRALRMKAGVNSRAGLVSVAVRSNLFL